MMKKSHILYLLLPLLLFSCKQGNKPAVVADQKTSVHPEWVYNATIYEVNTRQYTPEGTFNAFAQHLPRLKQLDVDILWFMPIQTIGEKGRKGTLGSYYSIRNYTEVNKEFGTLDDFKSVVKQAHEQGMKVILDWVANHSSRDNVWMTQHPDWYVRDSLGNIPVLYDWTDIAELNYDKADMRAEMIKSMMFWIREANIDGFRCDVAGEVPTDFWLAAKDSLKTLKPDIFLLAEAEKPELNESVFDAYYAWNFHHKMNLVAQGKANADSLRAALQKMKTDFSPNAIPMIFTSNHDENSWNGTEFERMGEAAKTFAALTYVLPGMPLIYSGQEVGLNRRLQFFEKDSISWKDRDGFTDFYRSLNKLKKSNPALMCQEKGGELIEIGNNNARNIWSFKRTKDANEVVCVFNFSKKTQKVDFEQDFPGQGFKAFPDNAEVSSQKSMNLGPWEYRIFYR